MKFGKEYYEYCKNNNGFEMNSVNAWHEEYMKFLIEVFGNIINKESISLDVGCATGGYCELFRKHGLEMFGCDVSQWYIDNTEFTKIKDKMAVIENNKIPFNDSKFDFVHMSQVIEHIPEEDMMEELAEIKRVMKSGAILYISTVGECPEVPGDDDDPTHISCFSDEKWTEIFENLGFINHTNKYRIAISKNKFADNYGWVNFVLSVK